MRAEVAHLFEVDPDDIAVIHNGIEPRSWRVPPETVRATRARHSPRGEPMILFFGRLEWEKGVHDLIAALPRIRRTHPGTRLVVAGRGRQAAALVALARKLRVVRSVDFVGHLPDDGLVACLAAADVVVLPSRYEPFGIVALEAAAAGAPLVSSATGGLGEVVIDGETGLSFAPGDVDGLAAGVRAVLDDPIAADRRARHAKSRLTDDFNWHTIAAATAEVYRGTIARDHPPLGRPKIASGNAFTP
jgi:glycogen(starch) synthase